MSRFPMPRYANGWFQVAYSDELTAGKVMPLRYFGRDLVAFRGEDGVAAVLDAHCPHMGAHLGHGGKVVGNAVECPFHAWRFCGTGECSEIPYASKIPPRARVGAWTVREHSGFIFVWHHAEGAAPSWELPVIPEYNAPDWTPYEKRRWVIKTHNQEMAENAVDSAHFLYVHGTQGMPKTNAEIRGHVLHVLAETMMKTPMGKVGGTVEVDAYGFGLSQTRFRGIVDTLLMGTATTIDDEYVELRFSFTVKKLVNSDVTSNVGKAFIREIERQLGQDIPIWENKIYVHPPLLCDADGPIGLFRKWVKQFYSEPQPRSLAVVSGG
ncbi:MAG: Rieske 2Fe-2S domain-containing protein [Deltaproteobacteria bacterium]|nr:Rieske 2Fe-2S domain-containing protein [Deltaproteobacteria bacterium]